MPEVIYEVSLEETAKILDSRTWEFKNKEDKKKCVWWNPLDWIPKYFSVKENKQ